MISADRLCVVCAAIVPDTNPYTHLDHRLETSIGGRTCYALICGPTCAAAWKGMSARQQLEKIFGNWRRGASILRRRWGMPDQPAEIEYLPVPVAIPPKPLSDFEKRIGIEPCPTPDEEGFPWKGCPRCKLVGVSFIARARSEHGASR